VVKWILLSEFPRKHFCETQNADCHWKVNQFREWIQAFWKFLNQNSAFSRSINIHHFLEFSTSFWESVANWVCEDANIFVDFFPTIMINILNLFAMLTNVAILKALLSLDQLFVFKRINLSLICFFFPFEKANFTFFAYEFEQCPWRKRCQFRFSLFVPNFLCYGMILNKNSF